MLLFDVLKLSRGVAQLVVSKTKQSGELFWRRESNKVGSWRKGFTPDNQRPHDLRCSARMGARPYRRKAGNKKQTKYHHFEVWLSLVERYVRDVEVASSNLVTSTNKEGLVPSFFFFHSILDTISIFVQLCLFCLDTAIYIGYH